MSVYALRETMGVCLCTPVCCVCVCVCGEHLYTCVYECVYAEREYVHVHASWKVHTVSTVRLV